MCDICSLIKKKNGIINYWGKKTLNHFTYDESIGSCHNFILHYRRNIPLSVLYYNMAIKYFLTFNCNNVHHWYLQMVLLIQIRVFFLMNISANDESIGFCHNTYAAFQKKIYLHLCCITRYQVTCN